MVYARDDINFEEYQDIISIHTKNIEKTAILVKNTKRFILVNLYRPPNSNFNESLVEISLILEKAILSGLPFIVVGDFNIDISIDNYITRKYTDKLQELQCLQIVKQATRISSHKKSIIDHCICNPEFIMEAHVLDFEIADHQPLLINWNQKSDKDSFKTDKYSKINYKKLKENIGVLKLELENLDCNSAFKILHEKITSAVEACRYQVSRKNTPKKPFISEFTVKKGRNVEMLRKKFLRHNTTYNEFRYRSAKREHQSLVRREKDSYYKNKLDNAKGDSGKVWKVINSLLCRDTDKKSSIKRKEVIEHNGTLYKTNNEICNVFNYYYRNIALEIAKQLDSPMHHFDYYLKQSNQPTEQFVMSEVTESDVKKVISSLSNKTSTGPDGLSNKILKSILPNISKELTLCINKSFNENIFPTVLKKTKISPLYKKNDRTKCVNYRPIAQLSPLSKLLEQIAMTQVTEFFDRQNIITSRQFGFREKHSTTHLLLSVKNFIETRQKREHIVLISLDLQKAFDCVNTDKILQSKILYYTKSASFTKWIDSFYTNRTQFTTWEGATSNTIKNHNISIVQGSCMGPRLFNCYINDLPDCTNRLFSILFADDSNFILSHSDPEILEEIVNNQLSIVKDYFDSNELSISIPKTTYLYFCPKNRKRKKLNIRIGNNELKENEEIVFLGITIDNRLSFQGHFEKVYEKAKKGLNGLIIARNRLNLKSKQTIYFSLIHSHFTYGALIWLSSLKMKQINALKSIQKKAIRAIHGLKYNAHTSSFFKESKITKIENLFEKESLVLTYKYLNWCLPKETMKLFDDSLQKGPIQTRSTSKSNLVINKNLTKGNLMFNIIENWNRCAMSLKEVKKIKDFKMKILEKQNEVEVCQKKNCYVCSSNQHD